MGTSSTFCSLHHCCSKQFQPILITRKYLRIAHKAPINISNQGCVNLKSINHISFNTSNSIRSMTSLVKPITNLPSLYDLLTQNQLETAWNQYHSENYDTINGPKLEWFVFYKFMVRIYSSYNSNKWNQLDLLISNYFNFNTITSSDYLIWMEANFHLKNFDKVKEILKKVEDSNCTKLPGHYLILLRTTLVESDHCIDSGIRLLDDLEGSGIQLDQLGLSFLNKLIQTTFAQSKSKNLTLCRDILSNWSVKDPKTGKAGYEMIILHLLRMGNYEEADYYYTNCLKSMNPSNHFFVQVFCIIELQTKTNDSEDLVLRWLNYMVELGMEVQPPLISRLYRPLLASKFSNKSFDFFCKLYQQWPITHQTYLSCLFFNHLACKLDHSSFLEYIERLPNSSYDVFSSDFYDLLIDNLSSYYSSDFKVLFPSSLEQQTFVQKALLILINLSIHHRLSASTFQRLVDMYQSFHFHDNVEFYNLLIKYYIQEGDPNQALELYNSYNQDVFEVTVLLDIANGFLKIGDMSNAYSLLQKAKDSTQDTENDMSDLNVILTKVKVLYNLKDSYGLEMLFKDQIESNFIENWNYNLYHTLAECFISLNQFNLAQRVIATMTNLGLPRNQHTFDILLKSTCNITQNKDRYDSQFKIYQQMKYCAICPSVYFVVELIATSTQAYGLSFGLSLLNRITNDFPDVHDQTVPLALVRYANSSLLPELAQYYFTSFSKETWTHSTNQFIKNFLDRCITLNEEQLALDTMGQLITEYNQFNTESYGSLIKVYLKCSRFEEALNLFQQFLNLKDSKSLSSNLNTPSNSLKMMNNMLQIVVENSHLDQIEIFVNFSQRNNISLTHYTLSILVNGLLKLNQPDSAERWMNYFQVHLDILPDTFIHNNFIIYYTLELHQIEMAMKWLEKIHQNELKPNQATYHTIIRECVHQSKWELATDLYRQMLQNIQPLPASHTRYLLVQSAIHQDRKDIADSIIQLT